MIVSWKTFESHGRQVEAQVWEPAQPTDKCIIFCPGFPGAGATVFEQRHAAALADAGYALVVLRHKGTRLDGPHAPAMVNNASRLSLGGTHIGGGPATINEWLAEPLTALRVLAAEYAHIDIIGNSFGALSSLWSLTRADAPLDNVRHLVLLAGAQGVHGVLCVCFAGIGRHRCHAHLVARICVRGPRHRKSHSRRPARGCGRDTCGLYGIAAAGGWIAVTYPHDRAGGCP